MAVVSTSSDSSASRDSGRMIVPPAVIGPETCAEKRSSTPLRPKASWQRLRTCSSLFGMAMATARRRIWTVRTDAHPSRASRNRTNRIQAPNRRATVVSAKAMLLEAGATEGAGARAGRGPADFAPAMSGDGNETAYCGAAFGAPVRTLARGSRSAAARAATQTACRWIAGPLRINRQASAATAAARGICQRELSRKVSRERLIVSMLFLPWALQQLLNLRELLRGQVPGFHQVQHQAIRGTSKKTVEHVADRLRNSLLAAEAGTVHKGTVLQSAFDLALAVEDVQHGLHSGVGQLAAFDVGLDSLHVGGAGFPQNAHDLQLQRRERLLGAFASGQLFLLNN